MRTVLTRSLNSAGVYDLLQVIAGERRLRGRLAPHLTAFSTSNSLIDIGGGTGMTPRRSGAYRYVCLDLDPEKLRRFRAKWPGGMAIEADATACPFRQATFDGVLCAKVVHHLNDAELDAMLAETARILKPGGVLILADAIRSCRWIPRLLWRLDRGAFPRSAAQIRGALPAVYQVTAWEQIRLGIFHDVVLCTARKTPGTSGTPGALVESEFALTEVRTAGG
jgi:ubiquinone/menaquinone biosynthesis C-methylase UbiE